MEFILQMQAKSGARMAKAEDRMDKFDKRLEGMRKLVQAGMKMLVRIEKNQLVLTEGQRKTDRKFDRLIDFWTSSAIARCGATAQVKAGIPDTGMARVLSGIGLGAVEGVARIGPSE
jgi:hypothetical protein